MKNIIYHYTTITGLIGILSKCELWASDCRFLNDGTELKYAMDLFTEEFEKLKLPPIEGGGYRIPDPSVTVASAFVTCFCEDGDLLSQWRGYGLNQGYALGFDLSELRKQNIGEINPVQYGIANPNDFFKGELEYATYPTAHPGIESYYVTLQLLHRVAFVKNPCFQEEKEWRLLKTIEFPNQEEENVNFRASPIGATGYIALPFPKECLREIIIGPGAYLESKLAAILTMLTCYGLIDVKCQKSSIPYRQ